MGEVDGKTSGKVGVRLSKLALMLQPLLQVGFGVDFGGA